MTQFFLRKGIVTICLNLSILLIGYVSLDDIANEFIPAIDIPAVAVVYPTTFQKHENVKLELVQPLERRLLETGIVDKVETTLERDRVITVIFYSWSVRPEESLQRTRQVVGSLERPAGVLEPILMLHRPTMSPIFRVALYGDSIENLTEQASPVVQDLERMKGVAEIRLQGASPRVGVVRLDPNKSSKWGINPEDIFASLNQYWNFRHLLTFDDPPAMDQVIRIQMDDIEDLKKQSIYKKSGDSIPLRWVAKIENTVRPPSVLVNQGHPSLILEVLKAPGSDALALVDRTLEKISQLKKNHPRIRSIIVYNEAQKIREAQAGVLTNFGIGVVLNSLVLLIFLGSVIGAVVASCVFPTALLGTLYIMKSADISLNVFALNGFSLASGMITDASIVVLESIMRRLQKGQDLFNSCDQGTRDVMIGVFASTLTTAAVIVPICLQDGISSRLFSDLGITLVTTQFICLIAVFSLVPWLCSKILKKDDEVPRPIRPAYAVTNVLVSSMSNLGQNLLKKSIENKKVRWGVPLGATLLSLSSLLFLPASEFLPIVSSRIYSLSVPVQRAQILSDEVQLRKTLSEHIGQYQEIEWVVVGNDGDSVNATFQTDKKEVLEKVVQGSAKALKQDPNRVTLFPIGPTPPTEPMGFDGYYFLRKGISEQKRKSIKEDFCSAREILACMGEEHYSETAQILIPNIVDMSRAGTNVLSSTTNLASVISPPDLVSLGNLALEGSIFLDTPLDTNVISYPLSLGENRKRLSSLGSIFQNASERGVNTQLRKNGIDYEPIFFRLKDATLGQATAKMSEIMSQYDLTQLDIAEVGTIESMNETFDKMILALVISAFLIFLVLLIQFQSVLQTCIVMFSIPLALGGSILGLTIYGETINVGVIVGFILLIGIIVNNGILLMEAINQRLTSGMDLAQSILDSVDSRTRPILMTAFSTIFGMMPTLLLEAEGKELYQGMAVVNVFGMLFGTFLTLVVIPIIIRTFMAKQTETEA